MDASNEITPEELQALGFVLESPDDASPAGTVYLGDVAAPPQDEEPLKLPQIPAESGSPQNEILAEELQALGLTTDEPRPEPIRRADEPPEANAAPGARAPATESVGNIRPLYANSVMDAPNLHALLDVDVELTVELGGVSLAVEELVALHRGSIISLDDYAEDPVKLLVAGRVIAWGEVVVVEEKFAVHILDLIQAAPGIPNAVSA